MPVEPSIQASETVGLAEAIRKNGMSPKDVYEDVGLDQDLLESRHNRIPLRQFIALLELVAERSGDACFGLRFGADFDPAEGGILGHVVLNSPTIEAAYKNLVRFSSITVDAFECTLKTDKDAAELSIRFTDPQLPDCPQNIDRVIALIVHFTRIVTEPNWQPVEVHFRHRSPADVSEYQQFFRSPILFDQSQDGFKFARSLLARPVVSADDRLLEILERDAREVLKLRPGDDDLVKTLEKAIVNDLKHGPPDINCAAKDIGMSARTLRRRLSERGLSYSGLVNDIRRDLACEYLRNLRLTLTEIAFLLGYSEVSAFNRAFKRWTDSAPNDYRRHLNDSAEV